MLSHERRVADRSYWLLAVKPSISQGAVAALWGGKLLSRHFNVTRDEFRKMCTIAHSLWEDSQPPAGIYLRWERKKLCLQDKLRSLSARREASIMRIGPELSNSQLTFFSGGRTANWTT